MDVTSAFCQIKVKLTFLTAFCYLKCNMLNSYGILKNTESVNYEALNRNSKHNPTMLFVNICCHGALAFVTLKVLSSTHRYCRFVVHFSGLQLLAVASTPSTTVTPLTVPLLSRPRLKSREMMCRKLTPHGFV